MRAFCFWLEHSLYDFPLMTMLYFSGFQKRKDESNHFNCNNLQTLNVLRNTSGNTKLVNDPPPALETYPQKSQTSVCSLLWLL